MSQQLLGATAPATPVGNTMILSSYEERVIRVLAGKTGEAGKAGSAVSAAVLKQESDLSDLRFSQTMNALQSKFLVFESSYPRLNPKGTMDLISTYSLLDRGTDYVLEMGYAH